MVLAIGTRLPHTAYMAPAYMLLAGKGSLHEGYTTMKRNNTRTMDGSPVTTTTTTTPNVVPNAGAPITDARLTGTVAHDGTPTIIAPAASKALAADASTNVVTGIPYNGVLKVTGVTYPFKGIRGSIYALLRDGMTVADFVRAARTGYRGGIEDVRIYVRKGIAVVCDANGLQVYPAPAPAAPTTAPATAAPATAAPATAAPATAAPATA